MNKKICKIIFFLIFIIIIGTGKVYCADVQDLTNGKIAKNVNTKLRVGIDVVPKEKELARDLCVKLMQQSFRIYRK